MPDTQLPVPSRSSRHPNVSSHPSMLPFSLIPLPTPPWVLLLHVAQLWRGSASVGLGTALVITHSELYLASVGLANQVRRG